MNNKVSIAMGLLLAVAFLINSMALFQREHRPWVIVHNPATNIADMVQATRDEAAMRNLMLGGFREAVAIATASHPYPIQDGESRLRDGLLEQFFAETVTDHIQHLREQVGVVTTHASPALQFNVAALREVKVRHVNGGLLFGSHFTQTLILGDNTRRTRTFFVQAFGHLAPATLDNPYQIKFSKIQLKEINIRGEQ